MGWTDELYELLRKHFSPSAPFRLDDVYAKVLADLKERHPENQHVADKIRQTLQYLRDAKQLEFLDNQGTYRLLSSSPLSVPSPTTERSSDNPPDLGTDPVADNIVAVPVFMELTNDHTHGGAGWEFTTCLWSPSQSRSGTDKYASMRLPKRGDVIVHCREQTIYGQSIVEKPFQLIDEEPPEPAGWAGRAPYYRIDLKDYQAFPHSYDLDDLYREHAALLRRESGSDANKYYPIIQYKDGFRRAMGLYLAKATAGLYEAMLAGGSASKARVTRIHEPTAGYAVDRPSGDLFLDRNEVDEMMASLSEKKNIILQGPPGVGKTLVARQLAKLITGGASSDHSQMVQFHQSYSYEDFVQGWRPNGSGGFVLKNGVFYELCRRAEIDPSSRYAFLIDEINRGNVSRIFGELMMLVEADKRSSSFRMQLTYAQEASEPFYVPPNLFLIGMMNTADRSLAMVDYALRRRFAFFRLRPAFDRPQFAAYLSARGIPAHIIARIVERMGELNATIAEEVRELGPGFEIGHSYFTPPDTVSNPEQWYRSVIRTEIEPLLGEYWMDAPQRVNAMTERLLE